MANLAKAPEELGPVGESVPSLFMERVQANPSKEAFRAPNPDDSWRSVTWQEFYDDVEQLAGGLLSLGLELEQRVGISSNTRFEWIEADFAVMMAGGATTTVYPSTNTDDVVYILLDSHTRIVFAEDDSQVAKLRESRDQLPDIFKVIVFDGTTDGDWVISMDDLRALGSEYLAANPGAVKERAEQVTVGEPRHPDLHVRNDRAPQGRRTHARQLGLRGRGHEGPEPLHPRPTCTSSGCRWRTRSARS